jgi:hypothetical protein
MSRNLKVPWLKDLKPFHCCEISLNNQDKVENAKSTVSAFLKKH